AERTNPVLSCGSCWSSFGNSSIFFVDAFIQHVVKHVERRGRRVQHLFRHELPCLLQFSEPLGFRKLRIFGTALYPLAKLAEAACFRELPKLPQALRRRVLLCRKLRIHTLGAVPCIPRPVHRPRVRVSELRQTRNLDRGPRPRVDDVNAPQVAGVETNLDLPGVVEDVIEPSELRTVVPEVVELDAVLT